VRPLPDRSLRVCIRIWATRRRDLGVISAVEQYRVPPLSQRPHPAGALLLAVDDVPAALARLVIPATVPTVVVNALRIGRRLELATLQHTAADVFAVLRVHDRTDVDAARDGLFARLARLHRA